MLPPGVSFRAIEAASPRAFANYCQWTARMLGSRGIADHTLEENLTQLEKHLSSVLLPEEQQAVAPFLTQGRQACTQLPYTYERVPDEQSLALAREIFLAAILSGQREAAINIVEEALRNGASHVDIYVKLFAESLHEVGELWEMNKISVAQEHMATAITQYAIASIYPRLPSPSQHRGIMVVTGVAGELHQIGANLVADSMEANGWAVQFLGTNLPHSAILSVLEQSSVDILCISTTLLGSLTSVVDLIQTVREKLRDRTPKIILGGSAYRLAARFANEVGAAGAFTDLRQAVNVLCD